MVKYILYIFIILPQFLFSQNSYEETNTYEYDNLNRLVKVVFNYSVTYEYTYDELGNRLTKDITVSLPYDNYNISTVGLSCVDSNDGSIHISVNLRHLYKINVQCIENSYQEVFYPQHTEWELDINNLEGGQYDINISILGIDTSIYQKKVRVVLDEPQPLKAISSSSGNIQTVQLLTGTAPYYISLNGKQIAKTYETEYSFEAKNGDLLEIRTSKECEGVYSEILEIVEGITVYPNPTNDKVNFIINSDKDDIIIKIVDIHGKTLKLFTTQIQGSKASISIGDLHNGVYFIVLPEYQNQTFKIIKE